MTGKGRGRGRGRDRANVPTPTRATGSRTSVSSVGPTQTATDSTTTTTTNSTNPTSYHCATCNQAVGNEAIGCDRCSNWFCPTSMCVGLPEVLVEGIVDYGGSAVACSDHASLPSKIHFL